jgi:HlyD family secretion protein
MLMRRSLGGLVRTARKSCALACRVPGTADACWEGISMTALLRRPLAWIALISLLVAAGILLIRARGPAVRTTTVVRQDLEQHLVASGRVRVPTRVQVAAPVGGLVIAVGAVEGQRVAAGDLLVQIEDGAQQAAVAQAQAAVDQAETRVVQLRRVGAIVASESLREAESNLRRARDDLARMEGLVAGGASPQVDLDNARRAVEVARARKAAAEAQQAATAPSGADSRLALTALLEARARLASAEAQLAQTRIVALNPGAVLTRSVEPGDVVQPSETLLVIAADAESELVFHADERSLAWLALGQEAVASADAYPAETFPARVTYIAPSIDPSRGTVEVRLAVPAPPTYLRPDMTVSIDLEVAARSDVLTLRSDAIRGAATAQAHVFAVADGRVDRRDVELGIRGDGVTEIVTGLDEGDEVIVPDGRRLVVGARVRPERD